MLEKEFEQSIEDMKRKYPLMFEGNTLFKWGFSIGPGWMKLFDDMCAEINTVLTEDEKQRFRWRQVKEKFASMRASFTFISNVDLPFDPEGYFDFKWSDNDDIAEALRLGYVAIDDDAYTRVCAVTQKYESLSAKTCEFCGDASETYIIGSWITTRCETHAKADAKMFDDTVLSEYQLTRTVEKYSFYPQVVDIDALEKKFGEQV